MKDIVILGSSGFAKEVLWLLEDNNSVKCEWNILGFVDNFPVSAVVNGYPVLGDDDWLLRSEHKLCVACGLGGASLRKQVMSRYKATRNYLQFPAIVSRLAHISNSVVMGEGCLICAGSILTVDISIGDFTTVNLDCTVGHDSVIGSFVTLNPSTNISGNVTIDDETEVGTGVQIIQGKHVGHGATIGAGSVIIRDVPDNSVVVGNPGRIL